MGSASQPRASRRIAKDDCGIRSGSGASGWQPGLLDPEFLHLVREPALTLHWNRQIEVPFGLRLGNPSPLRTYGDFMCKWPYGRGLREANNIVYDMWCAAFSLFSQDAAKELYDALGHGRLWFLPSALLLGISQMTVTAVAGGDHEIAMALDRALGLIGRIRWHLVDGAASTRPVDNMHGGPVYEIGDRVP